MKELVLDVHLINKKPVFEHLYVNFNFHFESRTNKIRLHRTIKTHYYRGWLCIVSTFSITAHLQDLKKVKNVCKYS